MGLTFVINAGIIRGWRFTIMLGWVKKSSLNTNSRGGSVGVINDDFLTTKAELEALPGT